MRKLNEKFIDDLTTGFLNPILQVVQSDQDLIFAIRDNAINIYYKGNSLLALTQRKMGYEFKLHEKLQTPSTQNISILRYKKDVAKFINALSDIKDKILALHRGGSEIEFEQMILRANNLEPRLLTDYLIIDRQLVTADRKGRFDLTGVHLSKGQWHRSKNVPLALLEIKYGLNPDIADLHNQLGGYYQSIANNINEIAEESESILQQKVALGLINHNKQRLQAYKQLHILRDIKKVRFAIVLVDYAPASKLLNKQKLAKLPFSDQIDIFEVGFGLWQANAIKLSETT